MFECNLDIIARESGEIISRGEAECNLAISECKYIQKLHEKACNYLMFIDISV